MLESAFAKGKAKMVIRKQIGGQRPALQSKCPPQSLCHMFLPTLLSATFPQMHLSPNYFLLKADLNY